MFLMCCLMCLSQLSASRLQTRLRYNVALAGQYLVFSRRAYEYVTISVEACKTDELTLFLLFEMY